MVAFMALALSGRFRRTVAMVLQRDAQGFKVGMEVFMVFWGLVARIY